MENMRKYYLDVVAANLEPHLDPLTKNNSILMDAIVAAVDEAPKGGLIQRGFDASRFIPEKALEFLNEGIPEQEKEESIMYALNYVRRSAETVALIINKSC